VGIFSKELNLTNKPYSGGVTIFKYEIYVKLMLISITLEYKIEQ